MGASQRTIDVGVYKNMNKQYGPFIVLGTHRSATSQIAKALHKSGVYMGQDLLKPDQWNPEGYYESIQFIRLNDEILRLAGGTWFNPPSRLDINKVINLVADKIKSLLMHQSVGRKSWGWKDPRTVLTIDAYMPFLEDPFFIICMRDPKKVALSLNKIHGFSLEYGIKLAEIYNNRIIEFMEEQNVKDRNEIL